MLGSKEGDTILETRVGRDLERGDWIFQARGPACHSGPNCSCGIPPDEWITVGPFANEKEANRACKKFERQRMKMHRVKVKPAPDPGSLD